MNWIGTFYFLLYKVLQRVLQNYFLSYDTYFRLKMYKSNIKQGLDKAHFLQYDVKTPGLLMV